MKCPSPFKPHILSLSTGHSQFCVGKGVYVSIFAPTSLQTNYNKYNNFLQQPLLLLLKTNQVSVTDFNGIIFTGELSHQNGKTVNSKLVNSHYYSVSFGSAK